MATAQAGSAPLPLPFDLEPMECKSAPKLPSGAWQYEPKWDGFRCLAFRRGLNIELMSKAGKSLVRYFPEVVARLASLPTGDFVLDGELVIPVGPMLDFEALQQRIHPAPSRIAKLSVETPATLICFDCLSGDGVTSLLDTHLAERRLVLEALMGRLSAGPGMRLSPRTTDLAEAEHWLDHTGGSIDGVVAKQLDDPYRPGERTMIKVKNLRSADCVVGGFRYASKAEPGQRRVGSLLLGLFDADGKLDHVGFTSGFADLDVTELTAKLEALVGEPGFTGDAPGGPSRWATERSTEWQPLRHELVVEVRYDHVTGKRFRHGTKLLRTRPDKAPRQCTFEQLQQEIRPFLLVTAFDHA